MKILFFSLIPLGIIILVYAIRMIRKTLNGKIILEMPYSRKSAEFKIDRPGDYSIWHQGQFFRKAPLDRFRPEVTDRFSGKKMELTSLLLRLSVNNGRTARMELSRFTATTGRYILRLVEGSSISGLENSLINILPVKKVDPDKYFIQVRESQPFIQFLAGILLIILAGFCMIGGLVIGILADQIFTGIPG